MVQGTRTSKIIKGTLVRLLSLVLIFLAIYVSIDEFYSLNADIFNYINPAGFFAMPSWAQDFLALSLALVFWSGVIFGTLGKKVDYIVVALLFLFALWIYTGTTSVTPQMYQGLIGVAVAGNLLGYLLKLAWGKWLSKRLEQ